MNSPRSLAIERGTEETPLRTVVEAPVKTPRQTSAVAYYPGCSLHGTSPEYDESLKAVVAALGIALAEIPDWNCCGASSGHMVNHELAVALPARNLALAESQGFDRVLAPCAACYNRLLVAHQTLQEDEDLAGRMPDILGRDFENSVGVLSAVQLLHELRDGISARVAGAPIERNLMGEVKLASYYGCLLVRPASVAGGDDVEQPMFMDDVVAACGAQPVDWNMKVECCGGAYGVSRSSSVVRLGRAIVEDARKAGAEAIVVACPLCHTNLDLRQKAMESRGAPPLPIVYITEIVGLALGLAPEELGLKRHWVDAQPWLRDLQTRAVERAAAAKKAEEEKAAKAAARAAKEAAAKTAAAVGAASPDAGGDA
jgi:heterodisulfide reductase subunit B2